MPEITCLLPLLGLLATLAGTTFFIQELIGSFLVSSQSFGLTTFPSVKQPANTLKPPAWFSSDDQCLSMLEEHADTSIAVGHLNNLTVGGLRASEDTCPTEAGPRVWQLGPERLLRLLLEPEKLLNLLMHHRQSASLYFIGDSVAGQQFRALKCLMEAAEWKRVSSLGRMETVYQERWTLKDRSFGIAFSFTTSFPTAALRIKQRNEVRSHLLRGGEDEVVFVGEHAWYENEESWSGELLNFTKFVQEQSQERGSPMIILRQPLPQHFGGATGLFLKGHMPDKCHSLPANAKDWRISAFEALVGQASPPVPFVEVWEMSAPLYFAHGKGHGMTDCTHYCYPALHLLNAALADLLGRPPSRR